MVNEGTSLCMRAILLHAAWRLLVKLGPCGTALKGISKVGPQCRCSMAGLHNKVRRPTVTALAWWTHSSVDFGKHDLLLPGQREPQLASCANHQICESCPEAQTVCCATFETSSFIS